MKQDYQHQPIFALIDGYTLVIQGSPQAIAFRGRHSRQAYSAFNDSWLIQILAEQTLTTPAYENIWRCLHQLEPCKLIAADAFGRSMATELWPITISQADTEQDWSLWELIDQQSRISPEFIHQTIWRWTPGDYHPNYYIVHSSVLKIIHVARSWVEHQQIPELTGIEILRESAWQTRFNPQGKNRPSINKFAAVRSAQTSLFIPPILRDLEAIAGEYLKLFADRARLYTPQNATYIRHELWHRLEMLGLIKQSVDRLEQLTDYPQLQRCVSTIDRLDANKSRLALDWLFFAEIYSPTDDQLLNCCYQALEQTSLKYPYSLDLTVNGQAYQLVTSQSITCQQIQLVAAIPIHAPQNPADLFAQLDRPSYLELLTWAALPSYPLPVEAWSIDWTGRESHLAVLGSDPSLPQASRLLSYLTGHLGNLWATGDQVAFDAAVKAIFHDSPAIQELRSRCVLLRSGELKFNYAEWCKEYV